ncbi:ML domain-containing protein [Chloropicon primus]|nr:hypothetical protein A3770_04p30030 [Chloropicon primus]UPQ99695.1 ML domain-containing protein [Chloropicon primus]|eukprot:QDZ20485.1 hypothetical protein A3770_04p30030 [Chloropicon primus]
MPSVVVMLALLAVMCGSAVEAKRGAVPGKRVAWEYCDPNATYPANVTSVRMNRYPPRAGDRVKLSVRGFHSEPVTGGTIDFGASFKGMSLYKGSEDLCRRSKCPVLPSGEYRYRASERLPRFTPPGVYGLDVNVHDQDGKEILCLKAKLPVMPAVPQ